MRQEIRSIIRKRVVVTMVLLLLLSCLPVSALASSASASVSTLQCQRVNGGFKVQGTIRTSEAAIVLFALYADDGRFLGAESHELPAHAEETMTFFAGSGAERAEVILLNLDGVPLCAFAKCSLSGGAGSGKNELPLVP